MSEETKNSSGEELKEVPQETATPREEPAFIAEPVTEKPAHSGEPQPVTEPQTIANPAVGQTTDQSPPPQNDGTSGKTVAALILGISSVALSFTMMLSIFGLAAGIVGLIFAIKERKTHPSGMATASFILSLIGLIVGAISTVACVACMGFYGWLGYWGAFDGPGTMDMYDIMDL
ncbi:MAG TPA: hypothetical protein PKD52_01655 [Clostridiales bacterium]|nr:hypothetical protein [Clostridiales bacterium]